ncbi:septum formation family protein [Streptomyces sp. NBC_00237]|uniref:septum formation family protein n=1 Tax=Streptomyces sp. NBC_00237 TaxID=2975687 RepID=UPI002255B213|nr:septum formation family protein [Streptomyces sp. NBC_00237]MCX5201434.1 septum formation family protein [Streptomyces sp. NBC_00237]
MTLPPSPRRHRRAGLLALRAALAAAALLSTSSCAPGFTVGQGPLATDWRNGTCHRLTSAFDAGLEVVSESAPSVACNTPHNTETLSVKKLTGPLAQYKERPSPFLMATSMGPLCNREELAAHLGARADQPFHGMHVTAFGPTRKEWSEGVRTVRCDAVMEYEQGKPFMNYMLQRPFKDILKSEAGTPFRLCRTTVGKELRNVGCDKPHQAESVGYAPLAAAGTTAAQRCAKTVRAYMRRALPARYAVLPDPVVAHSDQMVHCWVGQADRTELRTGSLYATEDAARAADNAAKKAAKKAAKSAAKNAAKDRTTTGGSS